MFRLSYSYNKKIILLGFKNQNYITLLGGGGCILYEICLKWVGLLTYETNQNRLLYLGWGMGPGRGILLARWQFTKFIYTSVLSIQKDVLLIVTFVYFSSKLIESTTERVVYENEFLLLEYVNFKFIAPSYEIRLMQPSQRKHFNLIYSKINFDFPKYVKLLSK